MSRWFASWGWYQYKQRLDLHRRRSKPCYCYISMFFFVYFNEVDICYPACCCMHCLELSFTRLVPVIRILHEISFGCLTCCHKSFIFGPLLIGASSWRSQYVFSDGQVDFERLKELARFVGKERLVLDLSCRKQVHLFLII